MQGHVATHGKAWSNYAEITDSFCRLEDGLHPASAFENQDTANIGKHGKTWENMGTSEPSAWLTSLSSGSHHWNTVDKRHLHHLCLQYGNVSEFPAERLARQIRSDQAIGVHILRNLPSLTPPLHLEHIKYQISL